MRDITPTATIAQALRIVAAEGIQTEDGVIEACLRQAANRLEELEASNAALVEALEGLYAVAVAHVAYPCTEIDDARAALALAKGES